ncbi:glycosyltransferase family 2 protein [Pusillimonas sp. MFBS29]|uniref:glycosyltransferase family 2 protein n=1 Tax=Pusillimonas sp. MFBS29 TaxID=2886690 RepID=UPI001D127C44|nr:glycosyltransferase family 2 protein [Pusillimonas sp. MFBS29]MCC2596158.1 glycosyltransferase family 2 protein [Pusillimonas sp. MFBS29]
MTAAHQNARKTYAVLVAYRLPPDELAQAIANIAGQVNEVVVCNNSPDDYVHAGDHVHVLNFRDNLGVARAQSLGMAHAFEHGADFVLQMDQDSVADEHMVARLLQAYDELCRLGHKPGLVGAQDYDNVTGAISRPRVQKGQVITGTDYLSLSETLSSGSLIPRAAYEAVGGMDDGLFIDAVDFEYCWRLRAHGFLVVKNPAALLGHSLGEGRKKVLGLIGVGLPAPFRHYYAFRNALHLMKRSYTPWYWRFSSLAKMAFKLVVYPFALDHGGKRLGFMIKGIRDGLAGRYGPMP